MNQSNEPEPYDTTSFCVLIYYNHGFYWNLIIPIFSFIFNIPCIFIFFKLIRTQKQTEELFKYFLVKSIVDTYLSIIFTLNNFFNNEVAAINKHKLLKQLWLIFGVYFAFVFQLVSMFLEVASSFNRFRNLAKKLNFMNKISYKISIFLMFFYSFLFYIFKFYEIQIVSSEDNSSEYIFISSPNDFNSIGLVQSIQRDGVCVVVIIILNLVTILEMRSLLVRKRMLVRTMSKEKASSIENRLTLMVLTMSSIAVVAHGLLLIYYISPDYSFFQTNACYQMLTFVVYSFSYTVNFLLYYLFNKSFKKVVISEFVRFLIFLRLKRAHQIEIQSNKTSIKSISIRKL